MRIPNERPGAALGASGMADAIQSSEAASRELLDAVMADPHNLVAIAAFNQSLKDREFLVQVASSLSKSHSDARAAVVQNMKA